MKLPRMFRIRHRLVSAPLEDPVAALIEGIRDAGDRAFVPGARVALAVGSRGIDRIGELACAAVLWLRDRGCEPFIVPAMGSHGGATAGGQEQVLAGLGITEASTGTTIESSMETVRLGTTPGGVDVFLDSVAAGADAVLAMNRVAPHTGYSGPVQSGLLKMLAVGLGNATGAEAVHGYGFEAGHLLGEAASLVIESLPELVGAGLVEDGLKRISVVKVMSGGDIPSVEPSLLRAAFGMFPVLPVEEADLLIVDEMGKDISGTGMDPLVTGRGKEFAPGEGGFNARKVVTLGLTEPSGGNATGVGHADVITERLMESIDMGVTRKNVEVSGALYRAEVPRVEKTDRDAVHASLEGFGAKESEGLRIVRIKNTRRLEELMVSEPLAAELEGRADIEFLSASELEFDPDGRIL